MQEVSVKQLGMTRGRVKTKMEPLKRAHVTFDTTQEQVTDLDTLVKKGLFLSRSEAMREALRDLISFYNHPEGSKKASVVEGRKT